MKKIVCLILVLVFALGLTGCGPEIADENGPEDTSLATITEENIINLDLGASSFSVSPGTDEENYMTDLTMVKGKEFSGVTEIFTESYLFKTDVVVDLTTINVKNGNFLVCVVVDDEIVYKFDNEEMMQTCKIKDVKGTMSIRIAGETADFKTYLQVW